MPTQIKYLLSDINAVVNRRYWRLLTIWFGSGIYVNVSYRIDRMLYLLFGKSYTLIRLLFYPLFLFFQILGGRHEIHYRADIGPKFKILHTTLGIVVNGNTIAGANLTLTGGNVIGSRGKTLVGDIKIGSNVTLGANAVVLGPIQIGNDTKIGAGAVVISDFPDNSILVGIPARRLDKTNQAHDLSIF